MFFWMIPWGTYISPKTFLTLDMFRKTIFLAISALMMWWLSSGCLPLWWFSRMSFLATRHHFSWPLSPFFSCRWSFHFCSSLLFQIRQNHGWSSWFMPFCSGFYQLYSLVCFRDHTSHPLYWILAQIDGWSNWIIFFVLTGSRKSLTDLLIT